MRHKKLKLGILFLLVLGLIDLQGQEEITASFGNFNGQGGSISYTAGQLVYTTFTGPNGSVGQGVQQPYEISIVTNIERKGDITLSCSVYPNPTINELTLKIVDLNGKELTYHLYDIAGKQLDYNVISGSSNTIPMSEYIPAVYFLKVKKNQKELITFKIIKK